MARKIRLEYPGATYHVMCRGDRREVIFLDEKDRWRFLDTLAQACERSGMRVHSYVLMTNHYHLLLETPDGNLVAGMRWFQSTYTARFNARHNLGGHLFQGRYKAAPIDPDDASHFLTVSDYIHLNPARAGLLDAEAPRLGDFRWSSYRAFVGARPLPPWLVRERVFGALLLPDEESVCRRRYAGYLARRVDSLLGKTETEEAQAAWAHVRRGWLIGGDAFRKRLLHLAGNVLRVRHRESYAGDPLARGHDEPAARRILEKVGRRWKNPDWAALPKGEEHKLVAAWLLRKRTTVRGSWIAAQLGMGHASRVSHACRAVEDARPDSALHALKLDIIQDFTD